MSPQKPEKYQQTQKGISEVRHKFSKKLENWKIEWRIVMKILSLISLRKIWNAFLVYVSFYLSKWFKWSQPMGYPIAVIIEPTTACNLRCPECPSGLRSFTRETGNLKRDFFRSVIQDIKRHSMFIEFYFQGEPFINPQFLEMVRYAKDQKLYTATSTNGHFLGHENCERILDSGLDHLIVSIDGTTQEVYETYRIAGNLDKVKQGVKRLCDLKEKRGAQFPIVSIQFLVVRHNEHQIRDAEKMCEELGANRLLLKTAQIYDFKQGSDLIPTQDVYSRYREVEEGRWEIKSDLLNQCWLLWSTCVVSWDGKVLPCCFDKDSKYTMGSLREKSFDDIWRGAAYDRFRTQILESRSSIDICQNCTEGCKVWG